MKPSQDEVWEWVLETAKKLGVHPLRILGDLNFYEGLGQDTRKAMQSTEKKIRGEIDGKEETKTEQGCQTRS